jgi:hypothetical protein
MENLTPGKLSSKIEIFEKKSYFLNSDNLKNSVQKMSHTIDNYLKNKKLSVSDSNLLYDNENGSSDVSPAESPSPPIGNCTNSRNYIRNNSNNVSNIELRGNSGSVGFEASAISMMTPQKYQAPVYQRSSFPTDGFNESGITSPPPGGSLYRTLRQHSDFGVYASPVPTQASSFGELPFI